MYTLHFTRYTLEISNFCEHVREYKWDSLHVNWMAYNISVVLTTDTNLLAIVLTPVTCEGNWLSVFTCYTSASKNARENTVNNCWVIYGGRFCHWVIVLYSGEYRYLKTLWKCCDKLNFHCVKKCPESFFLNCYHAGFYFPILFVFCEIILHFSHYSWFLWNKVNQIRNVYLRQKIVNTHFLQKNMVLWEM